jgi:hypothetical protein
MKELFGEVIHTYTRAQAIEDGFLIDVTEMAKEVGFVFPVAVTQAAWADLVAWNEGNAAYQDETGRLWDVLYMARLAVMRGPNRNLGRRVVGELVRIPNTKKATVPRKARFVVECGPGDEAEPVITIMLENED